MCDESSHNHYMLSLKYVCCLGSTILTIGKHCSKQVLQWSYQYNVLLHITQIGIWSLFSEWRVMAERVGCGTPCLLGSQGVREVVGSRPHWGNSKESFSSYQETGKVFSPEIPFYSKFENT